MPRIKYTETDVILLARLIRAEAVGEGGTGMMLVGNVVVNRVLAQCGTFKNLDTLRKIVYQKGQFDGVDKPLFKLWPTKQQQNYARNCLDYWTKWPATKALFFKNPGKGKACPKKFFGDLTGKYKNHCFYEPYDYFNCGL